MKERNLSIDVLRALGIILIILAHVGSPLPIAQFRCFDVPLMLFVSGLTFKHKETGNYWEFICKRAKRLVFPVWIFLSFLFLFLYVCSLSGVEIMPLSLKFILDSYLMTGGLGYTWIILVFLLVAVCTPVLLRLARCIRSNCAFCSMIMLLVVVQEVVYRLWGGQNAFVYRSIIANLIYGMFFMYGLRLSETENRKDRNFLVIFAVLAMLSGLAMYMYANGMCIKISPEYKYPPRLYFLIWGLFMSVICWLASPYLTRLLGNKLILFIGQNTIWIYLWHIPLIGVAGMLTDSWIVKFSILTIVSTTICFVQIRLLDMYVNRYPWIRIFKYLR